MSGAPSPPGSDGAQPGDPAIGVVAPGTSPTPPPPSGPPSPPPPLVPTLPSDGDDNPAIADAGWAWENPRPSGVNLGAVWSSAPNDVWAGGDGGILHFDGQNWHSYWVSGLVTSIWGSGPSDVWIVGRPALVMHWDGATLSPVTLTTFTGAYDEFAIVTGSASDDVWISGVALFGHSDGPPDASPTLLHYDGTSWSEQWPEQISSQAGAARIISFGRNDLIANLPSWSMCKRWDGTAWSSTTCPWQLAGGIADTSLWFIDGKRISSSPDGSGSTTMPAPIAALYAGAVDDAWLVAWEYAVAPPAPPPTRVLARYDGQAWSVLDNLADELHSISGSSRANVWAVGNGGATYAFDGTSWQPRSGGTRVGLSAIGGSSVDNVWAVGAQGTVLHRVGRRWNPVAIGSTATLHAVRSTSASDVWIAGDDGVYRFDGTHATHVLDGDAIAGLVVRSDDVWAVGAALHHFDGTSWTAIALPQSGSPNTQVLAIDAANVYVLAGGSWYGSPDTLYKWDGAQWSTVLSDSWLSGLASTSASDVWVAGSHCWHFDGTRWQSFAAYAYDISEAAPDDAWNSEGQHWDGTTWSPRTLPLPTGGGATGARVYAAAGHVWVAASSGAILSR